MTRVPALVAVAAALVLSACTGIPTTSAPQAVQPQNVQQPGQQVIVTPPVGALPRQIVTDFLQVNSAAELRHASARAFLTRQARSAWDDATGTTVVDDPRVGVVNRSGNVTVSGRELGSVDSTGVYTPTLRGDGTGAGGLPVQQQFRLKQVDGEWRIDGLKNGLLISQSQFEQHFQPRIVYFYDTNERHLVPDPRYSQLLDPVALANWLIARLAAGPRDALQSAATVELPAQTDPKRIQVALTPDDGITPTKVEIPGASLLDPRRLNRLAIEIGATLAQVAQIGDTGALTLTDAGVPVSIPSIGSPRFTITDFGEGIHPQPASPSLFYVHNGAVFAGDGTPMPGRLGSGGYGLSSVALADRGGASGLLVAGVVGVPTAGTLAVGTVDGGLTATKVSGHLSRPAWAPDVPEVWVGSGSKVYRVLPTGVAKTVPVTSEGGNESGRVIALRLSPEGTRVAIVISGNDPSGGSRVWIGSVVRSSGTVRVDGLVPISPQQIDILDVAWYDQLKLFAVGFNDATGEPGIYDMQCDGSLWTARSIGALPGEPDSITVATTVAVSAVGTVWTQQAGTWVSPQGDEVRGTSPIYVS